MSVSNESSAQLSGEWEEYSKDQDCEFCGKIPEQVVLLSCKHLLCLECLSKAIIENPSEEED